MNILQRRAKVKLRLTTLMIGLFFIGVCFGETATFIYKNGKVEFGEFKRMAADSVFLEKVGNAGSREIAVIPKKLLSEVVFDSGDKLNLSLSEYPTSASMETGNPVVSSQAHNQDASGPAPSGSLRVAPFVSPPRLRSPFVYGGFSAVVPGLGQFLQGEQAKGAICFGVVGVSVLGAMLAWNSATNAYNNCQNNKSLSGSYRDSDYRKFIFRLHGAELLTGVSAVLYLLNIADATADAFVFNKHPSPIKPIITASSTGAGCAIAIAF
jgi:hypothetical protein